MDQLMQDRIAIGELIDNWAIWRDAGYWDRFRSCWHEDGWMMATWIRASAEDFIKANEAGWEKYGSILHFLGGKSVYVNGDLAICETKMTISQRGLVHDVECDVVCTGRFIDFVARRDGRWGVVLRQPIYEKDRLDPVDPAAKLQLDADILRHFPEGYKHLAYIQALAGFKVKRDMPGLQGDVVAELYGLSERWLAGGAYDEVIAWRHYGDEGLKLF